MTTTDDAKPEITEDTEVAETDGVDAQEGAGRSTPRGKLRWPRSPRARIVSAIVVGLLVISAAGVAWLHSGRSVLGVHAGEGVLSFLPSWLPDGVAFQYGDRAVTADELDQHVQMLRALYGVQPPSDGKKTDSFRRDAAKSYAVSLVLDDAASGQGIEVADKRARDTLSRFVSERLGSGPDSYSQFIGTLADAGTSERVVLDELKRRLAMSELFTKVTGDGGKVGDKELKQAFQDRKQQLATPEKRRISNIVVETESDAERVMREIENGTSFKAAAGRSSLDGSTSDKGGDLGELSKDQLEKRYAAAAFEASEGEVFGPVKNQHGWNIGQVKKITSGEPAEFDAIKDDLRQRLQGEAALAKWRSWLGDQIVDADVRYADQYRPTDPAAPPETSPGQPGPQSPQEGPR